MSNVLRLDHLPHNTESPFNIKEICTYPHGSTGAWVVFKTPELAQHAATQYDNHHFGTAGQKVATSICSEEAIPSGEMNLLTEFRRNLENQLESHTVKITNLPDNHTGRSLNQLLEPVYEEFDMHPNMAKSIVLCFAGTYWKNATLSACCVPHEEIEELLVARQDGEGKDVMLFVTGIKSNTPAHKVREIFKDFPLRDVNMPPGGKTFCFIFVRQEDANSISAQLGKGIMYEGRTIRVSTSDKGKKNGGRAGTCTLLAKPSPLPLFKTTDLKLNNLPYGVTFGVIQNVFQGFNISKVIIKKGYAFVGIASLEAVQAVQMLDGKMVSGQSIAVKVAERRK
ncbi:hypothetical protein CC86DRAFT_446844 [Ophiobolus disseminans]|uniref:RRM domain-containing protein n=1 Tax=Ophiobolus disseminans TaxID=1469910 RepID=A0A6A6ZW28_9PLEO|nr:hypothetical protein CC86DRAFT_446844 [Ophiobolus disseminans]